MSTTPFCRLYAIETDRQTDGRTDGRTDRQTDTDRQREREIQTDRQTFFSFIIFTPISLHI